MTWFKKYWPWVVPLVFMIVYELYAVFTPGTLTLSEIVWVAPYYLIYIVVPIVVILVLHFWFGLWGPRRR